MANLASPEVQKKKNSNDLYIHYHYASYWPNESEAINYAFRESLINGTQGERNKKVATMAQRKMNTVISNLTQDLNDTTQGRMPQLKALIDRERQAEITFLNNHGFTTINDKTEWTTIIKTINKVVGLTSIFQRNLSKIKDYETGKTNESAIDISKFFASYLSSALYDYYTTGRGSSKRGQIGKNDIQNIVREAFIKMWNSKYYNGEATSEFDNAYKELADLMSNQSYGMDLIENAINQYGGYNTLKVAFTEAKQTMKKNKKSKTKELTNPHIKLSNEHQSAGLLLEQIENWTLNTIKKQTTMHTGNLNEMKADNIIMSFDVEVELPSVNRENTSMRINNINSITDWFEKLSSASGELVFISDKSYRIGSEWFQKQGGFLAEKPTLSNLTALLHKINCKHADELVFFLRNTGNEMINTDRNNIDMVRRTIASLIGNFLFDDVAISDEFKPANVNSVHLLNLDNIYIPLSVFLQFVYDTINQLSNDSYLGFVNVIVSNATAKGSYDKALEPLTVEHWTRYAEKRNNDVTIAIHFFKTFGQILTDNYNQLV